MRSRSPIQTDAGDVVVGASVGLAAFPQDASNKTKLLHAADRAMMRAKANGGGVYAFNAQQDDYGQDAEAFENAIANAVRQDLFRPAIQPIIDLADARATIGYEVLARWPDSGFDVDPTPIEFIPVIERLGMMDRFFVSLLRQALSSSVSDDDKFLRSMSRPLN